MADKRLVDAIRPGCRVTIVNRFGQQRTGRAVMRGPAGWVLNMGGKHGTPAIATDDNTTRVTCKRSLRGAKMAPPPVYHERKGPPPGVPLGPGLKGRRRRRRK